MESPPCWRPARRRRMSAVTRFFALQSMLHLLRSALYRAGGARRRALTAGFASEPQECLYSLLDVKIDADHKNIKLAFLQARSSCRASTSSRQHCRRHCCWHQLFTPVAPPNCRRSNCCTPTRGAARQSLCGCWKPTRWVLKLTCDVSLRLPSPPPAALADAPLGQARPDSSP